jgi:hypothetical protein
MGLARRRGRRRGLVVGAAAGSLFAKHRANKRQQEQDSYASEPEPAATQYAPSAPSAPTNQPNQLDQLEKLGQLKASGVLTEAEFTAKKQQILGI